jgi:catechol 2,3-dioxygenase-like lactoylglutathione lyase family enzyme
MAVLSLDHVNIRTPDAAATIAFFRDVLAMEVTLPAGRGSLDMGGWVLDERGAAVVHVASADQPFPGDRERPFTPMRGSGAIDHVALRCSGYDETKQRLEQLNVPFRANYVPQVGLHQIFVEEPTGIKIELNFPQT